jgi:hypothetical protein
VSIPFTTYLPFSQKRKEEKKPSMPIPKITMNSTI